MPDQATTWAEIKVWVTEHQKHLAKLPAPPTPSDTWGEKTNLLYRTLEGMSEQVNSEIEREDLRKEMDADTA